MTIEVKASRNITRQILRHKSFSFQEFCVAGDTKILTISEEHGYEAIAIEDLYQEFIHGRPLGSTSCYDKDLNDFVFAPIKEVFRTGMKKAYSMKVRMRGECEVSIEATKDHKFLLSKGDIKEFVALEFLSPGDKIITQMGESEIISIEEYPTISTYDLEVDHPEHNYLANGIVTHNSQRYSEVVAFEPSRARRQAENNRQSSVDNLQAEVKAWWSEVLSKHQEESSRLYREALDKGIAREVARDLLPESAQTKMYMTGSIRSWIHFLQLRTKDDTQLEHRDIANEIIPIFKQQLPIISEAIWCR